MPPHSLTNFVIQKYYQNEPRFDWVFSRDYLPKTIKGNLHVINLDKYVDVGTHWYCFILKKKWNCLFR